MRQMKDSGIEWIGEIPESWEITKHKYVMHKEKDICEHYNGEDIISLTMNGVIIRDLDAGGKMPTTFDGYQYVEPDKLLLCLFDIDVTPRCVGVIRNNGLTSPAYSKFSVHNEYSIEYYNYLLRAIDDDKVLVHLAKNLRSSFTETDFGALPTIAPPLPEQQSISAYLDRQCSHIDNIIEKTKASIEEYKKLRQAVITQAVTKGVRGDRPMKDSGIEWIGEIPEEWSISRVGLHFDIILGKMLCPNQVNDEYTLEPYYCAANVHFDGLSTDSIKEMWFSPDEKVQYKVKQGDLLVVEGGAGAGGSAIVTNVKEDIYIQNSIMIVRPRKEYSNVYLRYLIEYLVKSGYIDIVCNKATIPHFTKDKLGNVPFILNYEQNEIASFLDKKCTEIDSLISKKEQFLTELEAYKKSMIYEYVTGKKEVPQA